MKILCASLVMGLVARVSYAALLEHASGNLSLIGAIVIGAVVYFVMIYIMRIEAVKVKLRDIY